MQGPRQPCRPWLSASLPKGVVSGRLFTSGAEPSIARPSRLAVSAYKASIASATFTITPTSVYEDVRDHRYDCARCHRWQDWCTSGVPHQFGCVLIEFMIARCHDDDVREFPFTLELCQDNILLRWTPKVVPDEQCFECAPEYYIVVPPIVEHLP
jgi:hypothetical protein